MADIEVYVYPEGFGLASFDSASLAVVTYIRMCAMHDPTTAVIHTTNDKISPTGELPLARFTGAAAEANQDLSGSLSASPYRSPGAGGSGGRPGSAGMPSPHTPGSAAVAASDDANVADALAGSQADPPAYPAWDMAAGARRVIHALRVRGFDMDDHLRAVSVADTEAYSALVEEAVLPATRAALWLDSKAYNKHIRPLLAAGLPFPLDTTLPEQRRRAVEAWTSARQPHGAHGEDGALARASDAIRALAERLGDGPYFFGDRPSTLDAVVFAYLAVPFFAPLRSNRLAASIATYPNLTRFLTHVLTNFFADSGAAEVARSVEEASADGLPGSPSRGARRPASETLALSPQKKDKKKRRRRRGDGEDGGDGTGSPGGRHAAEDAEHEAAATRQSYATIAVGVASICIYFLYFGRK